MLTSSQGKKIKPYKPGHGRLKLQSWCWTSSPTQPDLDKQVRDLRYTPGSQGLEHGPNSDQGPQTSLTGVETVVRSLTPAVLISVDCWMTLMETSTTLLVERTAVTWTASAIPTRIPTKFGGGVSITTPKSTAVKRTPSAAGLPLLNIVPLAKLNSLTVRVSLYPSSCTDLADTKISSGMFTVVVLW